LFDLAVIGLGPGGMEAVSCALKNNLKVVAFENNYVGGCCLNVGCIPTKAILHSAKLYSEIKKSSEFGLNVEGSVSFDWKKILDRKDNIISKFKTPAINTLSKNITLINAEAELILDNNVKIKADNNIFEAKNIIVATGSTAKELPNLKFNKNDILSSDDLYNLTELPKTFTIVGSGAIGIEWGVILSNLGVEVTIVEKMPLLAPNMDIEVSKRLDRILKQNGIKVYKNDFIVSYDNNKILLNSGNEFNAEKILVAVGRKPVLPKNDKNIDLKIINKYETEYKNLFVIGDSTGSGMLAHSASNDAVNVLNKILFNKDYESKLIPAIIYITPEIASVGVKEQEIDDGYEIKKLPVATLAKSWCDGVSDGVIKLIIKDNLIKGATVISNEASSLIPVIQAFIELKTPLSYIENFVFPHPSYSELISEVLKRG